MYDHLGPRTSLTIRMTLSQRLNKVGENPYPSEFFETPPLRSLCEALSERICFPSSLPEDDDPITQKSREKVEPLSLLSSFFFFSLLFLPLPLSHRLVQDRPSGRAFLLPHVNLSLVGLDYPLSTYPSNWISIQSYDATCLLRVPLEPFV